MAAGGAPPASPALYLPDEADTVIDPLTKVWDPCTEANPFSPAIVTSLHPDLAAAKFDVTTRRRSSGSARRASASLIPISEDSEMTSSMFTQDDPMGILAFQQKLSLSGHTFGTESSPAEEDSEEAASGCDHEEMDSPCQQEVNVDDSSEQESSNLSSPSNDSIKLGGSNKFTTTKEEIPRHNPEELFDRNCATGHGNGSFSQVNLIYLLAKVKNIDWKSLKTTSTITCSSMLRRSCPSIT